MKRYVSSSINDFDNIKNDLENIMEEIDSVSSHVRQIYRKLPNSLYEYSDDPTCTETATLLLANRYLSQAFNLINIVKDYGYTEKFDKVRRQYDY